MPIYEYRCRNCGRKTSFLVLNPNKPLSPKCPKCGNDEAHYFVYQTRAADEAPTIFYKCTRCGYRWRSYD